jgi:hypothetical protein
MATSIVPSPSHLPQHLPCVQGTSPAGMSFRPAEHHAPGVWTFYVSSATSAGTEHTVQHIRRRGMNRWQCSCPQFFFRCVARRRHCKHIRAVRAAT